jgi:hypothetical protein
LVAAFAFARTAEFELAAARLTLTVVLLPLAHPAIATAKMPTIAEKK